MKPLLQQLLSSTPLTAAQAEAAFAQIMSGDADPHQVSALLTLLTSREPTVDELLGLARVMRRHVTTIAAPKISPDDIIDTCGTGGVSSRIFNVSTAAALVAAACGVKVAKHGNRSVTSRSGSSDVLLALGVNIDAPPKILARCLTHANICFAYAPKHHPAMRHVATIRQALGFSTIFNTVGPLTNPAGARRQLVGVKSPQLAHKVLDVLVQLGALRAMVVSGLDDLQRPLCELSVSGTTYVAGFDGTDQGEFDLLPEKVGLSLHKSSLLEIQTPQESAILIQTILTSKMEIEPDRRLRAARDIVLLNAAAALWVAGLTDDLATAVPLAREALLSGRAHKTLQKLVKLSHAHP